MTVTRRTLLGSAFLAAAMPVAHSSLVSAQDATPADAASAVPASPEAVAPNTPGYGIVRVRTLSTPELTQAVFPDVMYRFLPATAAVPGYFGYLFAFGSDNPADSIAMTLLENMEAAVAADEVATAYVAGLDPRLTPETPMAEQGPIRVYVTTDRTRSELPPGLTGCQFTARNKKNTGDTDIDALVTAVQHDLAPMLQAMDGFVLYGWMMTPEGRVAFNIWETADQLAAGDKAIADWVAANPVAASSGETEVHAGIIGYAEVLGDR